MFLFFIPDANILQPQTTVERQYFSVTKKHLTWNSAQMWVINTLRARFDSSGSQKAADSNVALRMNISALVRSSNSAKISKNVASLVD